MSRIGEGMLGSMAQLGLEELRAAAAPDNGASAGPVSLESLRAQEAQAPAQEAQQEHAHGMEM